MPRNSFKCSECGANYKHCHRQKALEKGKPDNFEVYLCDGRTVRHPHPPILIEVTKVMIKEGDPAKAKQVLHTLKMNLLYVDPLYDYMAEWREYMANTFSENAIKARQSWHPKAKKQK